MTSKLQYNIPCSKIGGYVIGANWLGGEITVKRAHTTVTLDLSQSPCHLNVCCTCGALEIGCVSDFCRDHGILALVKDCDFCFFDVGT